jgi:hypothetical protein
MCTKFWSENLNIKAGVWGIVVDKKILLKSTLNGLCEGI